MSIQEKIAALLAEIEKTEIASAEQAEQFRIQYLGRKGVMNDLFEEFKAVPNDQKKTLGKDLNVLKMAAQSKWESFGEGADTSESVNPNWDFSIPSGFNGRGKRHPLSLVQNEIISIFEKIGFQVAEGPEIEDDWHVFSGLNFPPEHPARDMQDTFFVQTNPDFLLRTHTSSVQVREMEKRQPPFRIIMPGRVFRNEAISSRAHCQFHQIEGLYIDKNVSFADMKATLLYFVQSFFGKAKIRLRPSYFPFTEPSAELDVYWGLETEADYRITKGTGWLEIMGCGMVDPAVLSASGINPEEYSGFAFGMGIERITMLRYQIDDLRHFFENDMRFLEPYQSFKA
jgi:phenylalanyl-tRNA synthetase alpha chain